MHFIFFFAVQEHISALLLSKVDRDTILHFWSTRSVACYSNRQLLKPYFLLHAHFSIFCSQFGGHFCQIVPILSVKRCNLNLQKSCEYHYLVVSQQSCDQTCICLQKKAWQINHSRTVFLLSVFAILLDDFYLPEG